jgi:hypothetical protein
MWKGTILPCRQLAPSKSEVDRDALCFTNGTDGAVKESALLLEHLALGAQSSGQFRRIPFKQLPYLFQWNSEKSQRDDLLQALQVPRAI